MVKGAGSEILCGQKEICCEMGLWYIAGRKKPSGITICSGPASLEGAFAVQQPKGENDLNIRVAVTKQPRSGTIWYYPISLEDLGTEIRFLEIVGIPSGDAFRQVLEVW